MVLRFAAGFSRSFSFSFRPSSPPPPPAALARSILSSRRWTLVSTNTDTGPLRSYITRPLSFSVALYLSSSDTILFHRVLPRALRPLPGLSTRLVLLSPLLRPLSSPRALLQRVQRAAHSRYIPRWVSNTYLHGRGTTVSVPGQLLTRSTHRDCPRAPP